MLRRDSIRAFLLLLPLAGCDEGVRREYCEQLANDREWCTRPGDATLEIQTERCLENWETIPGAAEAVDCLNDCRAEEEEAGADLCGALISTFSGGSCNQECDFNLDTLLNASIDSE